MLICWVNIEYLLWLFCFNFLPCHVLCCSGNFFHVKCMKQWMKVWKSFICLKISTLTSLATGEGIPYKMLGSLMPNDIFVQLTFWYLIDSSSFRMMKTITECSFEITNLDKHLEYRLLFWPQSPLKFGYSYALDFSDDRKKGKEKKKMKKNPDAIGLSCSSVKLYKSNEP